jgi:hypothetical protein
MKKIFFLASVLVASMTINAEVKVATFENEAGGINVAKADTCWQGADAPAIGWNNWKSGDFNFQSYYGGNSGYGDYFTAFTVTNEKANTSIGYMEPYRSIKGGAYQGDNFVVWNLGYYGVDTVTFDKQVVKGFFVNNTPYTVGGITTSKFSPATQFTQDDYLVLFCIGLDDKAVVDTVEVFLAKDGKYISEWTYVDLSALGEINGLYFGMDGSDQAYGYLNTPAYFAMDNFGAAKPLGYEEPAMTEFEVRIPEAIDNTNAAVKAVKVIRNGQVVIVRDGKMYNVLGAEL